MPRISQLVFTHGEEPEEIVKKLEKEAYRVDGMFDTDLRMVYPEDHSSEPAKRGTNKGTYTWIPLDFKFDKVIIVYGNPGDPNIAEIYYAQTYV